MLKSASSSPHTARAAQLSKHCFCNCRRLPCCQLTPSSAAAGLFLASLAVHYTAGAKRFMPEALALFCRVMHAAAPTGASALLQAPVCTCCLSATTGCIHEKDAKRFVPELLALFCSGIHAAGPTCANMSWWSLLCLQEGCRAGPKQQ